MDCGVVNTGSAEGGVLAGLGVSMDSPPPPTPPASPGTLYGSGLLRGARASTLNTEESAVREPTSCANPHRRE